MKKILHIITKFIEYTILTSLAVVFIIVISPILPTKNYASTYVVSTGSMEPSIKVGSIVLTIKATAETLNKGDIIGFSSPSDNKQTIIHRIVDIKDEAGIRLFSTKGDNNNATDPWLLNSQMIKGKYFFVIPYIGYATNYLKTPIGFFIGIGIPALLLAILQIKKIKDGINEEVDKKTKAALAKYPNTNDSANSFPVSKIEIIILSISTLLATSIFAQSAFALFSSSVTATFAISTADKFKDYKLDIDLIKHAFAPFNETRQYGETTEIQIFEVKNNEDSKDSPVYLYLDDLKGSLCDNLDLQIFLGNDESAGEAQNFEGSPDLISGSNKKINISNAINGSLDKNKSVYVFVVGYLNEPEIQTTSSSNHDKDHKKKKNTNHNGRGGHGSKDDHDDEDDNEIASCSWDTILTAQLDDETDTEKLQDNILKIVIPDIDVDEDDNDHEDDDHHNHPKVGHKFEIKWHRDNQNSKEDKKYKEKPKYEIDLYDEDGKEKIMDIAEDIDDSGQYEWNVPKLDSSKKYRFRITSNYGEYELEDFSENSFSIED